MEEENEFFVRKLELDYGDKKAVSRIQTLAKKVSWLKGWPESRQAFWNGESFMWGNKISKERRELIKQELSFLERKKRDLKNKGKLIEKERLTEKRNNCIKENQNLDIGCGSYSYVNSVGFDISERMLQLNDNLVERVAGDVEKKLPFASESFGSATLVFLLDYVNNYSSLLGEVFRVLKNKGKLVVVQSKSRVNPWQRQQAVNNLGFNKWKEALEEVGFKVELVEKEGLGFFKCLK